MNIIKKLQRIIYAKFFLNKDKLKEETSWYEERLMLCKACPNYSLNVPKEKRDLRYKNIKAANLGKPFCNLCGCEIEAKTALPESNCPDNPPKWTEI